MRGTRGRTFVDSWPAVAATALALALSATACLSERPEAGPGTVRLAAVFEPDMVAGRIEVAREQDPVALWRFDEDPPDAGEHQATFGWRVVTGVTDLRVDDGRLVGAVTDELAVLHVERSGPPLGEDQLHALQVGLQVGGGELLSAAVVGAERLDDEEILERASSSIRPWQVAVSASDEIVMHSVRSELPQRASSIRHVVLVLHGAAGERFAIDEVRVVTAREHLAAVDSGVGWQGLTDVYRETLVARSPEHIRIPVRVPAANPWLDLEIGTPETRPVRFSARIAVPAETRGDGVALADRLVTTPHRWEPALVDLAAYAGRDVVLELALEAEEPGTLGYWGSPVVRSRLQPPVHPQSVVLLLADTLRPDHMEAYGYARATGPTLVSLAEEGTLFRDVVAQATWTKASVPSIVTSLHPTSHRVQDFDSRLSDTAVTLAELYQEAGYATAAFSSVLFTGTFSNLQQGYEVLHERSSLESGGHPSKTARELVDRATQWIAERRDVPFFVFLHVFDPHDPFRPRPPDDVRWADADAEERHRDWQEALRAQIDDPLLRQFGMPTSEHLEAAEIDAADYVALNVDWYDGAIRGLDSEVARLMARLDELGLAESTLVVFTSDHGEEFLEHGRTFHGQSVYGELAQVPLLLWGPGAVPAGRIVEETVRTIDIMPTLLELSGLPLPPFLQGQSLLPLLGAERGGWRPAPAVVEKARTESEGAPPPHDTESFAIVSGGWKLVHHRHRDEGTPEHELFDHAADPLNLDDVAAEHPEVVERLARELGRWHRWAEAQRLPEVERAAELTSEERERLRGLGYIQ